MFLSRVLSALVALLLLASVRAEMNVTIDDMDPRVLYQPAGGWSFLGNIDATQDRMGKTTHYTSQVGSTASLTFTVACFVHFCTVGPLPTSRLQGAVYVYYIGYPIASMSPPALIPTTLQPWHGSAITVESDAYRPVGSPSQMIIFSSNRLDPTETYTITVSKTNATLNSDVNVDAFILTQPDGADLIITSSPAQTTDISGTTHSVSLGTQGATSSGNPAQTSSVTNAPNTDASINAGAIAGGVLGGIVAGITITFFATRWWLRRGERSRPPLSVETPRPLYFNTVAATYPSMDSGASRAKISSIIGRRLVSSTPVRKPPLTQNSVQIKTRYTRNGQPNNSPSAPLLPAPVVSSPEDTCYSEITLPAYSQIYGHQQSLGFTFRD